jgi:aspartate aminotransferase
MSTHVDLPISRHLHAVQSASAPFVRFLMGSAWSRRMGAPGICDFVVGNPHDMPMPAYVDALHRAATPREPGWFGYKTGSAAGQELVARRLSERVGLDFESDDVLLTNGATMALFVALSTVLEPGEEVIFLSPPWFFYESMIAFARGEPVRVRVDPETFDLDVPAISAALSAKTRAVIVNSPNNPTGRIYPRETLEHLSEALEAASERYGKRVYLISDECYSRIVFDGAACPSPAASYPHTFIVYSYGKVLLAPGERLGYVALPPAMPERDRMRGALMASQFSVYGIPDALLQHALPDLEGLSIDMGRLQRRRDVMVGALRGQGYEVRVPEGAFYLLVRSPLADDVAFAEILAEDDVFVLPGSIVELPGYLRICLTASDEMIDRSLPVFDRAIRAASHTGGVTQNHGEGKVEEATSITIP